MGVLPEKGTRPTVKLRFLPPALLTAMATAVSLAPLSECRAQAVSTWITVNARPFAAPSEPGMSTSGTFQAGGQWYRVPLSPGWQIIYSVASFGILWSPVAPPVTPHGLQNPETSVAMGPAKTGGDLSAGGLYLSLPAKTSSAKRPDPLVAATRLLVAGPSVPLFDRVTVSLSVGTSLGLYTVEDHSIRSTEASVYAVAPSGHPARIAQLTLAPDERLASWPAQGGAILALGRDTSSGWTVKGSFFLSVPQLQKVDFPASVWPLAISTDPASGTVTVFSGPQAFLLGKNGAVTRGYAPVAQEALAALRQHVDAQALVVPLPPYPSSSARWRLTVTGPDAYEWMLPENSGSGLSAWTASVTSAPGPAQTRTGHPNAPEPDTPYEPFFGSLRPLHVFSLGSQEGPVITWIQAAPRGPVSAKPVSYPWFASFVARGWKYEIGPFTDPANRSETTLLSYLIERADILRPSPLGNGTAYVKIGPKDDLYTASMILFHPVAGTRVTITGSGLDALSAPLRLGVWIKGAGP